MRTGSEEHGSEVAGEGPAADEEPCVEDEGQDEGLGAGFLELVDGGFGTEGGHGHGEQEGADPVDDADDLFGQQVEAVEDDDGEEPQCEPGHCDFAFGAVGGAVDGLFGGCLAGADGTRALEGHPVAEDEEHGDEQHHAYHLHDDGDIGHFGAHGVAGAHGVCHFVEGGAGIDAHFLGGEAEDSGAVGDGVDEHGECAEDNDGGDGDGCLVGLGLYGRLGAEHGGGAADAAADGGEQGDVAVHLHPFAHVDAADDGDGDDDGVNEDAGHTHGGDVLECEAEAVEDDAQAQQFLGAELDAGDPCLGEVVAQGVGVEHTQHDAYDHRAEGEFFENLGAADVEGGATEEGDQQDAVEHAASFFS